MEQPVFFRERQGFKNTWLRFVLPVFILGILILTLAGVRSGKESVAEGIVAITLLAGITLLLFTIRLETRMQAEGIYVRFHPFHRRPVFYPWESIRYAYVREYHPIAEYGGWGIRAGFLGRSGGAYNLSGNTGIQLVFHDGKRQLIGTCKPQEAMEALKRVCKWRPAE